MTKEQLANYLAQKYYTDEYDDSRRSSWYLEEFQSWRGGAFFDDIGKGIQWGDDVNEAWNKYFEADDFDILMNKRLKELLGISW